jgi:hypothetical protein
VLQANLENPSLHTDVSDREQRALPSRSVFFFLLLARVTTATKTKTKTTTVTRRISIPISPPKRPGAPSRHPATQTLPTSAVFWSEEGTPPWACYYLVILFSPHLQTSPPAPHPPPLNQSLSPCAVLSRPPLAPLVDVHALHPLPHFPHTPITNPTFFPLPLPSPYFLLLSENFNLATRRRLTTKPEPPPPHKPISRRLRSPRAAVQRLNHQSPWVKHSRSLSSTR